jgi:hypothetical protein
MYPVVPLNETAVLLVGAFVTSAAPPWSCVVPGGTPIMTFEDTTRVPTFAVPVIFELITRMSDAQKLFENHAFPWTVRFAVAPVPIPTFEDTTRVPMFADPVTFAEVASRPVVQKLFENQAFP